MNGLCIVIRRAPYGTLSAAEGVRHLMGAAQAELSVHAVLIDDGVHLAKQGQDSGSAGWTNLSDALGQALGSGATDSSARLRAYVHRPSAETRGLDHLDLISGVELIGDAQLAAVLASADALLIF